MVTRFRLLIVLISLAIAAAVAADVVPVVSFDQSPLDTAPAGWKLRGTNGYASKMSVVNCELEGKPRRALQVGYNFEADPNKAGFDPGAKSVVLGCWVPLPADTRRLRVTMSGDASGHGLIVAVGEPANNWFNFEGQPLSWLGNETFEIDLQGKYRDEGGSAQNGKLDPPLFLTSLNLLQNAKGPATGSVQLISVEAVTGPPSPVDDLVILPWGSVDTGVVCAGEVEQAALRVCNPTATDVTGTLSWKITSPFGYTAERSQPCLVAAKQRVPIQLAGLPASCSYYDIDVRFTAGEARRDKHLSCVVVPPASEVKRRRYGLGVLGAGPNLGLPWVPVLRRLGADCTMVVLNPAEPADPEAAANLDYLVTEICQSGLQPIGCLNVPAPDFVTAVQAIPALRTLATRYQARVDLWCSQRFDNPDHTCQFAKLIVSDVRQPLGNPAVLLPLMPDDLGLWRGPENVLPDAAGLVCETRPTNLEAQSTPAQVAQRLREAYREQPILWTGIINRDRGPAPNQQPSLSERHLRDARGLAISLLEWTAAGGDKDTLLCPIVNRPLTNWSGNESRLFSEWSHPLPSAAAYATITSLLREASSATREQTDKLVLLRFATPRGPVLAAWSASGQPSELRLNVTGSASRTDFLGGRDELKAGELAVPVGPDPIYFQGQFTVLP